MDTKIISIAISSIVAATAVANPNVTDYTIFSNALERVKAIKSITNQNERIAFLSECAKDTNKVNAVYADLLSVYETNSNTKTIYVLGTAWYLLNREVFRDNWDNEFAEAGCEVNDFWWLNVAPKCARNTINALGERCPLHYRLILAHIENGTFKTPFNTLTIPELLNCYVEMGSKGRFDGRLFRVYGEIKDLEGIKTSILKKFPTIIKRYLRQNNRSFITKEDGINPVQEAIDEISRAMNAPKGAGIKEICNRYFPEYEWVNPNFKSDEEISKLRDDVYYGEKPFSGKNKFLLLFYLGEEEYNRFVEEYNK